MTSKHHESIIERRPRLIAVTALVLCLSQLFIVLTFVSSHSLQEDQGTGPWKTFEVELGEGPFHFLDYPTWRSALEAANGQLEGMHHGDVIQLDAGDPWFYARVIRDCDMGGIYYWVMSDSSLTACLDARSGELIHYRHDMCRGGNLTSSEAGTLIKTVAWQFAPLPDDRSDAQVAQLISDAGNPKYLPGPEHNTRMSGTYWSIEYTRLKDLIPTTDRILVLLDMAGGLVLYHKDWFMDISDVRTTGGITEQQAIEVALHSNEGYLHVRSVEKVIIRPNYFAHPGWEPLYGTAPRCVYKITMVSIHPDSPDTYFVDSETGKVVEELYYD